MNTDARRLDHKTLTEVRKRAVISIQGGESPASVAVVFGVNERTVYRWLAAYRSGGWGELDARKRGGRPRKLDAGAMKWIYDGGEEDATAAEVPVRALDCCDGATDHPIEVFDQAQS